MQTFTVFCREADGTGTTWISAVYADDADSAAEIGRAECADDWGFDSTDDVKVIGVAAGKVPILFWED